ncbi:alpha/beta-hydrolase [Hypoxylon sp. NC1633]|nr:alpha/beta-hydrolase [Hypoxylon sp. NC1633]
MKLFQTLALSVALATATASPPPPVRAPFNTSHSVVIGENTWHYLRARPTNEPKGTVLLLHGFPALPYLWKYQVPIFTSLGYQVIAPEMLGYGQTSSPSELDEWSFKKLSVSLAALLDQIVPDEQVILGGHDWGAALVWRFAMWYPQLFKAIFSLTFAYPPPPTEYVDLADQIAAGNASTFKYQLELRDQSLDRKIQNETEIREFLTAAYGGATPDGTLGFTPDGFDLDIFPSLQPAKLLNGEELDLYVAEFLLHSFRGPLNWYRTAKINFEDELPIAQAGGVRFAMPTLFVQALKDAVLIPELAVGQGQYFDNLTSAEVDTGHWMPLDDPDKVNKILQSWLATLD